MIEAIAQIIGYAIMALGALAATVYVIGRLFEVVIKWTGYWPMLIKAFQIIAEEKHKQKTE